MYHPRKVGGRRWPKRLSGRRRSLSCPPKAAPDRGDEGAATRQGHATFPQHAAEVEDDGGEVTDVTGQSFVVVFDSCGRPAIPDAPLVEAACI